MPTGVRSTGNRMWAWRIDGKAASIMRMMSAASFSRFDRSNGSCDHAPPKILKKPTSANVTATASASVAANATTGELAYASVSRHTPFALDITSNAWRLDAAKKGVRIGAHDLREELIKVEIVE
jgi:hypothetical protein